MRLAIERICVPTDFSQAADHAVHFGAALAHSYNAALHLLNVMEHSGSLVHHPDFSGSGEVARAYFRRLEKAVADAEEKLQSEGDDEPRDVAELIRSLEAGAVEQIDTVGSEWWSGLEVIREVRHGHPVKEINRYVKAMNIDLVVMGTHGQTQLGTVLGSVTARVVQTCSCPVTVVRHPEHQYNLVD